MIPGLHIISYSSFPEIPNSPTVHEVSKIAKFSENTDPRPLVLIKVHGNTIKDIEVIPATSDAYMKQDQNERLDKWLTGYKKSKYEIENPFEINEIRSPLSPEEVGRLTRISRNLEKFLGYSINTESKLVREGYNSNIYLLQLRPVPVLENFSPMVPLDKSQHVLAHTPFG